MTNNSPSSYLVAKDAGQAGESQCDSPGSYLYSEIESSDLYECVICKEKFLSWIMFSNDMLYGGCCPTEPETDRCQKCYNEKKSPVCTNCGKSFNIYERFVCNKSVTKFITELWFCQSCYSTKFTTNCKKCGEEFTPRLNLSEEVAIDFLVCNSCHNKN